MMPLTIRIKYLRTLTWITDIAALKSDLILHRETPLLKMKISKFTFLSQRFYLTSREIKEETQIFTNLNIFLSCGTLLFIHRSSINFIEVLFNKIMVVGQNLRKNSTIYFAVIHGMHGALRIKPLILESAKNNTKGRKYVLRDWHIK